VPSIGSRERKRRERATPAPLDDRRHIGCTAAFVVYVTICLLLYARDRRAGWLIIASPALILLAWTVGNVLYQLVLLTAVRFRLTRHGVRCVVVHSQSPVWADHIASEWLPRFGTNAALLDWTERRNWGRTIEVAVFKQFCLAPHNFNPAVIVFRGWKQPYVFRFYNAFHEARHGRTAYLEQLEREMFAAVERAT
jgi:hypothetical protein